jgi:RNA polymerase sigma factor (sigma-70 family)
MSHRNIHEASIAAMLAQLNREENWRLSEAEQQAYLSALLHCVPDPCDDDKLKMIINNYHQDHTLVEALRDHNHLKHESSWSDWTKQTLGILHQHGLDWSNDIMLNEQDLVQVAQAELAIAIDSFSYASRFKTWAYRVIVWSAQRKLRDLRARKRGERPEYIDQSTGMEVPVDESMQPDAIVSARLLAELVAAILAAQPDQRLETIFRLWAREERSVKEIGALVHLHPSRVRVLLKQAQQILQNDPGIQLWHDTDDNDLIERTKD